MTCDSFSSNQKWHLSWEVRYNACFDVTFCKCWHNRRKNQEGLIMALSLLIEIMLLLPLVKEGKDCFLIVCGYSNVNLFHTISCRR